MKCIQDRLKSGTTEGGPAKVMGLILISVAMAVLIFSPLLQSGVILFSTDNNIGQNADVQWVLRSGGWFCWADSAMFGGGSAMAPVLTSILNRYLSVLSFTNWVHALYMAGGSFFLMLFLRRQGVRLVGLALAGVVAFWLSSHLALVYSGHTGKYGVLLFITMVLWGIQNAVLRSSVLWSVIAGGGMGLALLEQQDVALFLGFACGSYAVFSIVKQYGWQWGVIVKLLLPMAIMAIWIALPFSLLLLKSQTQDAVSGGGEGPEAKWEFATQWSLPPDESLALLAPGYMGWRSGEPDGPYWGRLGRSGGWEQSNQGFMNFKLDDWYVGTIPVIFAILAILVAFKRNPAAEGQWEGAQLGEVRESRPLNLRADVYFWAVVMAVSLFLAYGKYFLFYQVVFHLPVVGSIRNPVKFLHVFQIALAVLTAYGVDSVSRPRGKLRDIR